MADDLVQLVLEGGKRATAGALWSYEQEGDAVPVAGQYSVITDGRGRARCIIVTTSVEIVPFARGGCRVRGGRGGGGSHPGVLARGALEVLHRGPRNLGA